MAVHVEREEAPLPPILVKRSLNLAGHATSLALEPEFWRTLQEMAGGERLSTFISRLDQTRGDRPLASACRVAALAWARQNRSP